MCVFRWPAWPNDLLQWTQLYALSLLWVTLCFYRLYARPNNLLHSEQMCIFTSSWLIIWLTILFQINVDWKQWKQHRGICRTGILESVLWYYGHFYFLGQVKMYGKFHPSRETKVWVSNCSVTNFKTFLGLNLSKSHYWDISVLSGAWW